MQTLHIEDAHVDYSSVPGYTVVNWGQVNTMEFDYEFGRETDPVRIVLRMADGKTVRPRTKIKGFSVPVVARELKTFVHTRDHFAGHADFSEFQAYLEEKHDEK